MQSLWTSLSGLKGSVTWLDRAANNLANVNTPGFAENTSSFADTLTHALSGQATVPSNATRYTPPGWWGGTGVAPLKTEENFSQMTLNQTGNPTDLAIQGNGFFVTRGANGQVLLTKAGNFNWSQQANGSFMLATPNGNAVLDVNGNPITVSANQTGQGAQPKNFTVGPDGQVAFGTQPGPKIAIADVFLPGQTLTSVGNNQYVAGPGAQPLVINRTATAGTSTMVQGALSMSNVNLTVALGDLLQAQRMFDLNSEAISLTNRMMADNNTIRP